MADSSCFFAALTAWRSSHMRHGVFCESPWLRDRRGLGILHSYVLARVARPARATVRGFAC